MKITLSSRPNTKPINFCGKNSIISPKVQNDTFSVLEKYSEQFSNSCYKNIISDVKEYLKSFDYVKEKDIKGILAKGGLSVIFDMGEKAVLKCSLENPLEYRKHCPDFDIPFLSPVIKINQTYIVKQAKADTKNLSIADCNDVISRIKKAGFELSQDMDSSKIRQIGKYNGKNYLLDTRCAVPPPNAFSRFIYNFCKKHKYVYELRDMSPEAINKYERELSELSQKYGPQVYHVNETPRKNLSLKEGFAMILSLIKENIKYGQFPL